MPWHGGRAAGTALEGDRGRKPDLGHSLGGARVFPCTGCTAEVVLLFALPPQALCMGKSQGKMSPIGAEDCCPLTTDPWPLLSSPPSFLPSGPPQSHPGVPLTLHEQEMPLNSPPSYSSCSPVIFLLLLLHGHCEMGGGRSPGRK